MSNNKLTIGIPVYNEGQFLEEALQSLLNQDFQDFIVVIADNCSTDNSWEIIQKYCSKDNRITAFQQKCNLGMFENWRCLLDHCKTSYFMWLGGHDFLAPDFLKTCIEAHERNPEIALAFTGVHCVDFNSKILLPEDPLYTEFNDDLDSTKCQTQLEAWVKVMDGAHSCSSIQGVFNFSMLEKAEVRKIFSLDTLILFTISQFGDIYIDKSKKGYFRRIAPKRADIYDNSKEATKHFKQIGLIDPNVRDIYLQLGHNFFKVIKNCSSIGWQEKLKSSWYVYYTLGKRKGFWNPFYYWFYRSKN